MKKDWQNEITKNFSNAAEQYDNHASLQKSIVNELASLCAQHSIPKGIWLDLGSGTGFLAESLEILNPTQKIIRIDSSKEMLNQHASSSITKVWDLNEGLPPLPESPKLIVSSFAIHWLMEPAVRIKEWFESLSPGGLIAVSLPVRGSFPEWLSAAKKANVPITALDLPTEESCLKYLKSTNLKHNQIITYTQKSSDITSLLKSIVNVGANSSKKKSLSVGEWRRLRREWLSAKNEDICLTWKIQLLIIQK